MELRLKYCHFGIKIFLEVDARRTNLAALINVTSAFIDLFPYYIHHIFM